MKKIKTLVFTFLLLFFSANLVQAMSLDEIYRDVVRSDNAVICRCLLKTEPHRIFWTRRLC